MFFNQTDLFNISIRKRANKNIHKQGGPHKISLPCSIEAPPLVWMQVFLARPAVTAYLSQLKRWHKSCTGYVSIADSLCSAGRRSRSKCRFRSGWQDPPIRSLRVIKQAFGDLENSNTSAPFFRSHRSAHCLQVGISRWSVNKQLTPNARRSSTIGISTPLPCLAVLISMCCTFFFFFSPSGFKYQKRYPGIIPPLPHL